MKKTPKKKTPTIDEISEMAAEGKDVSEYFTRKFTNLSENRACI